MPSPTPAPLATSVDHSLVTRLFENRSGRIIAVTRLMLAAVRHLKASSIEREAQQDSAGRLKAMFREAGLPVMDSTTHIVPLMVGDPVRAKKISDILLAEYGVYVQPINFPTVPRGTERLRFTPGRILERVDSVASLET